MANNIGTINKLLPRVIGETITIDDTNDINAVSGFPDIGFIGFDNDGTMGICTSFMRDEQDQPVYIFRTCSLNTQIDVKTILSKDY